MNKKSKPRKKPKTVTSAARRAKDIWKILWRIKPHDDPVRYVVYGPLFRGANARIFLDVSMDTFRLNDWTRATLFKQERIAHLVARVYSEQQQRAFRVARVTIAGWGKRGGGRK